MRDRDRDRESESKSERGYCSIYWPKVSSDNWFWNRSTRPSNTFVPLITGAREFVGLLLESLLLLVVVCLFVVNVINSSNSFVKSIWMATAALTIWYVVACLVHNWCVYEA